ncbi:MAG: MFS transporter [Egibacteraceae bacterium]
MGDVAKRPADGRIAGNRWWGPGVLGIGSASFLADVGHEIPTSLLPALLAQTFGAPAAALGLIEGLADGLAGIARVGGGALADDPARRRATAVGGYAATAVLSGAIGAATHLWQVGVLRAAAWTARGLRVPARNALLADLVPAEVYGRAYGFERAMDNLGAIAGPLVAIPLVAWVGTRAAIGLSVIPGLLAASAIIFAIRRTPVTSARPREPLRIRVRPVLASALRPLMLSIGAFELGNIAATLLVLRATELLTPVHGPARGAQLALGLYVAYNIAAAAISIPAGRLSDRLGPTKILAFGTGSFAMAYAAFATSGPRILALAGAFVAAGVGIGCVETAEHSAVAVHAPAELRGSAFGLLAGAQSFGNLAASGVAGLLWTTVSPTLAFAYTTAWMLIALSGLLRALAIRRR